jgi:hypothetical protein
MRLIEIGFLPKRVASAPDSLHDTPVLCICSVANCISCAPERWIESWAFNEFGMFNRVADAELVCGTERRSDFTLFAFRQLAVRFDRGQDVQITVTPPNVEPQPPNFRSLGFDAVSRSNADFFECSPLSCNGGAIEFDVNEYCLLRTLGEACDAARAFSVGNWEPGPYFVLEVLSDLRLQPTG